LTSGTDARRKGYGSSVNRDLTDCTSRLHPSGNDQGGARCVCLPNCTRSLDAGNCRCGAGVHFHIAGFAASKDSIHVNVSVGVYNDNANPTNGGNCSHPNDSGPAHDRVANKPLRRGADGEGPGSGIHSHLVNLAGGKHPSDREKGRCADGDLTNLPSGGYPRGGYKGGPSGCKLSYRASGSHTGDHDNGLRFNGNLPDLTCGRHIRDRGQS
jgi:hypothetical protein